MSVGHLVGITLASMLMVQANTLAQAPADATVRAKAFIAQHEAQVKPLEVAVGKAWWNANISGKDEDFKAKEQAQNRLDEVLANRERFAELTAIRDVKLADALLKRQIDVLYLAYLEKQVDPELLKRITSKANAIEQAFNVFRPQVGDKTYSDSEVRQILQQVDRLGRTKVGVDRQQGGGRQDRVGPEGAGGAAERGGHAAGIQELSRHATGAQRAEAGRRAGTVR